MSIGSAAGCKEEWPQGQQLWPGWCRTWGGPSASCSCFCRAAAGAFLLHVYGTWGICDPGSKAKPSQASSGASLSVRRCLPGPVFDTICIDPGPCYSQKGQKCSLVLSSVWCCVSSPAEHCVHNPTQRKVWGSADMGAMFSPFPTELKECGLSFVWISGKFT